jgi:hypothetical protein
MRAAGVIRRSSAVPARLRAFVAADADLLVNVLTDGSMLSLLGERLPGIPYLRTDPAATDLYRLYRSGVASDEWVLGVAMRFEQADRRRG